MNPLHTGILLLSLGLFPSLSMQGQNGRECALGYRPPEPILHLGITLGAGVVADRGGMEAVGFGAVAGLDHDGPRYYEEYGCGVERSVGLAFGLDLDERFRLEVSGGVAQRSVEYEMEEGGALVLLPEEGEVDTFPRSYLTLDADILLLGSTFSASYSPLSIGNLDVRLHGGIGVASVLEATFEGRVMPNREYWEDSSNFQHDSPPIPTSIPRQEISDTSPLLFSLHGALSLNVPI